MKTQQNNGGPAFPYREEDGQGGYEQHQGMSLRDYFAAQALVGMLSEGRSNSNAKHWMPEEAYELADAMLAAREASK
jgi:hypothetical protein